MNRRPRSVPSSFKPMTPTTIIEALLDTDNQFEGDLQVFTDAYMRAILFTENDESDDSGGDPLDDNYGIGDFTARAERQIQAECREFFQRFYDDLKDDPEQAGIDFWLSRVGSGCGFSDSTWPDDVVDKMHRVVRDEYDVEGQFFVNRGKVDIGHHANASDAAVAQVAKELLPGISRGLFKKLEFNAGIYADAWAHTAGPVRRLTPALRQAATQRLFGSIAKMDAQGWSNIVELFKNAPDSAKVGITAALNQAMAIASQDTQSAKAFKPVLALADKAKIPYEMPAEFTSAIL